jgi:hypothetical protein
MEEIRLAAYYTAEKDGFKQHPDHYWYITKDYITRWCYNCGDHMDVPKHEYEIDPVCSKCYEKYGDRKN